ncbi:MAG: 50S ribosomal protein L21 [Cyanobacteria bacterium]|nr:50S ribosomal protein L21 [Cyanobacteriota bacterium]
MSESPATTPTVTDSSVAAASVAAASAAAASTTGAYAIVEASGQQFWLQSDRYLDLDRIAAAEGETVVLDNVLLVKTASGTTVGQPYITGATVELKVMAHRRGPKIIIYKMRPKKKTRRKNGHRQELTRVMVQSITVGGKPIS